MLTSQLGELKHTQLSRHLRSALLLVTGLNSVCVCVCVCVCEIRRQVISDQAFVRKLLSVF